MSETSTKNKKGNVALTVTIVLVIVAILFILAALLVFEYGSKTTVDGDTITPWYFWLLLSLGFASFVICILVYIFVPSGVKLDKKDIEMISPTVGETIGGAMGRTETGYIISKSPQMTQQQQVSQQHSVPHQHLMVHSHPMEPSMSNLDTLSRYC